MNLSTILPSSLWSAVSTNYEKRDYRAAILDGCYFLSDLLRNKSGCDGDGASLVGSALGGESPKIRIGSLQSESGRNLQKGFEQMLRGFYLAIRNPRSHEKLEDTAEDAQNLLVFLGYIVRKLEDAKSQFSVQDFLNQVLDKDFVPRDQYAEILVNRVPDNKRLETFIAINDAKVNADLRNIRRVFHYLVGKMSDAEKSQVVDIVSEELQSVEQDSEFRAIIGTVDISIWKSLDEAARLRAEHKITQALASGSYNQKSDKLYGGALGTWGIRLVPHFQIKDDVIGTLSRMLASGDRNQEDYVLSRCMNELVQICDEIPYRINQAFIKNLRSGVTRFYDEMLFGSFWRKDLWSAELKNAYEKFVAKEDADEDDIPF